MFLKKQEAKRRHPLCTLMVFTMATIGVCAVVTTAKDTMSESVQMVKKMFCKKKPMSCEGGMRRCPVCGEPRDMGT